MAKKQIVLKTQPAGTYKVLELLNLVEPTVGTEISKKEVQELLQDRKLTIKIK